MKSTCRGGPVYDKKLANGACALYVKYVEPEKHYLLLTGKN